MKKYKIILSMAVMAAVIYSCKKSTPEVVSKVVTASAPTITITGPEIFSIPVGGSLPTVQATAYDSVLGEACPITLDASGLDNSAPGLNFVAIKSSNKNGYISSKNVAVAVTNIASSWDLSGTYKRVSNGIPSICTKLANGFYQVSNVGGSSLVVVGYFVQTEDAKIDFPLQSTSAGDMDCTGETLVTLPGDTSYAWVVKNASFGPAVRTFAKQ
jgi:hypothetical protein